MFLGFEGTAAKYLCAAFLTDCAMVSALFFASTAHGPGHDDDLTAPDFNIPDADDRCSGFVLY